MPHISYIRKKVKMSDFHIDGGDITVMAFGAGFAILDQVIYGVTINAGMPQIANKELVEVCIKAAVGAVVGLTVKAVFECLVAYIKTNFIKKSK